jgi:hypothetical protein
VHTAVTAVRSLIALALLAALGGGCGFAEDASFAGEVLPVVPADLEGVRDAMEPYRDIGQALADGYSSEWTCETGDLPPHMGAVGVHFGKIDAISDGSLDPLQPEILLYHPTDDGYELVGVEWMERVGDAEVPSMFGQRFDVFDTARVPPLRERLGLPEDDAEVAFLHAWLWAPNERGLFADSNSGLRCPPSAAASGGDYVFGYGGGPASEGTRVHLLVDAGKLPSGKGAGRVDVYEQQGGSTTASWIGDVRCLALQGSAVVLTGEVRHGEQAGRWFRARVEDRGADPGESFAVEVVDSQPAPCSAPTSAPVVLDTGNLTAGPAGTTPLVVRGTFQ